MQDSSVVVIVPAFNEGVRLESVLRSLKKTGMTFVVVDDGSADNTASIARKFSKHVLVHKVNIGKGAALKTGCEFAFGRLSAEAVVFVDADSQHDIGALPLFLQGLKAGYPVILGERMIDSSMPLIKIIGNRLASVLVNVLFGMYIPDIPSGYKAMTKWGYRQVKWKSSDYKVELEIAVNIAKKHVRFCSVPIKTIYVDYERGFHFLDALSQIGSLLSWRFSNN